MPLKNAQYNALMRVYNERQLRHAAELENLKNDVYARVPRYKELKDAVAENASARARARILGNDAQYELLEQENTRLKNELQRVMAANGLSEESFSVRYTCPDCRDTGFVNGEKCHCFVQAAVELLYDQSNIREILKRENFSVLSMEYYEKTNANGGKTQYDYMAEQIAACCDFVKNFDRRAENILFYGPTGTGKTFLSNCIAKALLDTCHSVVYFSAIDLLDLFSRTGFSYDEEDQDQQDQYILESDLLIIDDLGTERVNRFTLEKLFYTINERLARQKSTIISTNLTPGALRDEYTERIASRILSNYELIQLAGEDIRIKKRFGREK